MDEKRLTVLVESQLLARFKAQVAIKNLTMSDVVRELVENWLKKHELTESPPPNLPKNRYFYTAEQRDHH
jgi:hypothetical protein